MNTQITDETHDRLTVEIVAVEERVIALLKTPCLRDEYPKAAQMLDAAVRNLNAAYVKINDGNDEARS